MECIGNWPSHDGEFFRRGIENQGKCAWLLEIESIYVSTCIQILAVIFGDITLFGR